jgi:hypothetical protein
MGFFVEIAKDLGMIKATIAYYLLLGLITFAAYYLTVRWDGKPSGSRADPRLGWCLHGAGYRALDYWNCPDRL